jgi:hypothetical protein
VKGASLERASAKAYVQSLYRELLAREPPETECAEWVAVLLGGSPPDRIRTAILESTEYISRRQVIAAREAIARSGLFDREWYLGANPDVAGARLDPLEHYAQFGRLEGRWPNAYFVDAWYRAEARVGPATDALLDYAERGEPMGIPPGPNFDPVWYREAYQLSLGASPLAHFLARKGSGRFAPTPFLWALAQSWSNGRVAHGADPFTPYLRRDGAVAATVAPDMELLGGSGLFDDNHYLIANADVAEAGMEPLLHFSAFGWREKRNPNPYFDTGWYLATNPDAARLRVNPLLHYLLVGEARDRRPVAWFEPGWYRRTYGLGLGESPLAHYLANRHSQTVSPNSLFDPVWFMQRHGNEVPRRRDPFAYYLFAGTKADLQPSPRFDAVAWRRQRRGRRSRHFGNLLVPEKDNPLVDYLLATYR